MNNKFLKIFATVALFLSANSVFAQTVDKNTVINQNLAQDVATLNKNFKVLHKDMQRLRKLLDNRAMLELFQRMDDLADEVSNLRGLLEQQNHDLAGLKKRQRELYLDTDRRLRDLEAMASRVPAVPSNAAPVQKHEPIKESAVSTKVEPATKESKLVQKPAKQEKSTPAKVETMTKPIAMKNVVTDATVNKSNVSISEERAAYQKAFDMLKEGRYKMANTSFKSFIQKFPQSSYAGNAQYWQGESNYVTRLFDQAVKDFESVVANYPSSNKVPDAMLKLGYTYYELRQFDLAKKSLMQLKSSYSSTTAARLASKRLERMRKEGR